MFMSKERILLIGNSGLKKHGEDGQTIKVRLYLKKIQDEGFLVTFVDLEMFLKNPLTILSKIKKGIKNCDRIVLISAKRGCKTLIPFINRHNKKYQKPFILPLIGTSVLHYSIDKLDDNQKNDFILNHNYSLCKRNKNMSKQLSKITYILPETDSLTEAFKGFYSLNNVYTLNNFREIININKKPANDNDCIRFVFLSRVMRNKGIFDLLSAFEQLSLDYSNIVLDIYGKLLLNKEEDQDFQHYLQNSLINYKGAIDNRVVCSTLSQYDFFVFPTRFVGEGTPGVIVESLIGGTPVLTTDFPQAHLLLNNNVDSVFCKMFDEKDLKSKLLYIIMNRKIISNLKRGASASGKKYTYDYERKNFLKHVCGVEEE